MTTCYADFLTILVVSPAIAPERYDYSGRSIHQDLLVTVIVIMRLLFYFGVILLPTRTVLHRPLRVSVTSHHITGMSCAPVCSIESWVKVLDSAGREHWRIAIGVVTTHSRNHINMAKCRVAVDGIATTIQVSYSSFNPPLSSSASEWSKTARSIGGQVDRNPSSDPMNLVRLLFNKSAGAKAARAEPNSLLNKPKVETSVPLNQ